MQIRKTFLFNSTRDSDILKWLDQQDNASKAVREALRFFVGYEGKSITLEDIYNELQEIRRQGIKIGNKDIDESEVDEPADIVANLNELGL